MARRKFVSRTITGTQVEVMCLDTKKVEPLKVTVTLAGTFKDEKAIMKALAKSSAFTDEIRPAKIIKTLEVSELRGVDEEKFLEVSVLLDTETRKPIGDNDDDIEVVDAE